MVIDDRLAEAAPEAKLATSDLSPHTLVKLAVQEGWRSYNIRVLWRPKKFSLPEPEKKTKAKKEAEDKEDDEAEEKEETEAERATAGGGSEHAEEEVVFPEIGELLKPDKQATADSIDEAYRRFSVAAENELCNSRKIPMAERAAYKGRGETARFVWRTLAPKCEAPEGSDNENGGWRWTASRLKWLKAFCSAAWLEGGYDTPKLTAEEPKRAQQIQKINKELVEKQNKGEKSMCAACWKVFRAALQNWWEADFSEHTLANIT